MCWFASLSVPAASQPSFTRSADLDRAETVSAIEQTWGKGQEGAFQGQRNVRIVYRVFAQPELSNERGAIVIVSGRTESMLKYKETIHDLWSSGYSVYIHDHRGQGLSDREPDLRAEQRESGHVHRFSDYVDDLRQFTREKVLPGLHKNLYLLAHSMGGAVTARFLESGAPEVSHFRAAVLSSPMLAIKSVGGLRARLTCALIERAASGDPTNPMGLGDGKYAAPDFSANEYTGSEERYKRLVQTVAANEQIKLGAPTRRWLSESCAASKRERLAKPH